MCDAFSQFARPTTVLVTARSQDARRRRAKRDTALFLVSPRGVSAPLQRCRASLPIDGSTPKCVADGPGHDQLMPNKRGELNRDVRTSRRTALQKILRCVNNLHGRPRTLVDGERHCMLALSRRKQGFESPRERQRPLSLCLSALATALVQTGGANIWRSCRICSKTVTAPTTSGA